MPQYRGTPGPKRGSGWVGDWVGGYGGLLVYSDSALEKMLYLASGNVIKKWTQRYRNWDQVLNQLIVLYGGRLTCYL